MEFELNVPSGVRATAAYRTDLRVDGDLIVAGTIKSGVKKMNPAYPDLTITRLRDGGFMVNECFQSSGYSNRPIFASGEIEPTLKFVKSILEPKPATVAKGRAN